MKIYKESDMTKGWFIGDFNPAAYRSKDCEVCLKRYKAGDIDQEHLHQIATEITVIVEGKVRMGNNIFEKGDILVIEPGESTDFEAITDSITVVTKVPCVLGDKYEIHSAQR